MAYAIPAADFLGISIIMADCDLDQNVKEIITRCRAFQEEHNRCLGMDREEFRKAYYHLLLQEEHRYEEWQQCGEILEKRTLRSFVPIILQYSYFYSNDEGESWDKAPDDADWFEKMGIPEKRFWEDGKGNFKFNYHFWVREDIREDAQKESLIFERKIRDLFKKGIPEKETLRKLFTEDSYAKDLPSLWSKQGESR